MVTDIERGASCGEVGLQARKLSPAEGSSQRAPREPVATAGARGVAV